MQGDKLVIGLHGICTASEAVNMLSLKLKMGLGGIRSLRIHLPTTGKKKLIPGIFAEMSRLQFLEISVENSDDLFDQVYALAKELQFLETELRFLCWLNYPLKSLPENFCTDKLVILKLQYGRMEKLWDGLKNLVNLKELDLMHSKKLKKLPDLSQATNLEELVLLGCSMLTSMDSSIFSLPKLESIDLSGCKSLTLLTSNSQFCNFSYLNLDFCKNLREFSLISQNMKELRLGFTKVKVLPSSFECHSKLKSLHLTRSDIEMLPSSFNNLTQLQHLDINNCNKLQTIPELPPSLKTLEVSKCKSLQNLRNLPSSLKTLNAIECKSLKTVSFPSTADEQLTENKKRVLFWNCRNLDESSAEAIGLNAEINLMELANQPLPTPSQEHQFYNDYEYNYHSYQGIYVYPGSSVPAWFKHTEANGDIIIDLSSASPFELFGFIFCFVLNKFHDTDIIGRLEFNITISDVDDVDEGKMGSVKIYIDCYSDWSIAPYHVCVMFDQRCSSTLNNIARKQKRFKINVSVGARIEFYDNYHELPQEVSEAIRSIHLTSDTAITSTKKQMLSPQIFAMRKLKFLDISGVDENAYHQVILGEGANFLATELRFLNWERFPMKSLPESFNAEKLVILDLMIGRMTKLWDGVKNLANLKRLILYCAIKLKELPDLSGAIRLEELYLSGCDSLTSLHSSIFSLPKLEILDLHHCISIAILPSKFEKRVSSLWRNSELRCLNMSSCEQLETIADLPPFLKTLNVSFCLSLKTLPKLPLSLQILNVSFCESLESLPELPPLLSTLNVTSCYSLQIPTNLPLSLQIVNLCDCSLFQTLVERIRSVETKDTKNSRLVHQTLSKLPLPSEISCSCNSIKTGAVSLSSFTSLIEDCLSSLKFKTEE
ncbi:Protein SUPPRESSOR OF npr1-1 [Vigna angularis]|uniref:Protein SUPPRESSOR OF npr1-1 n=1 Tax=Phaseolus angularis TaxID=3914 RepID=A0A8T0KJN9_PHAAN|nr:Protein SUPPRESSOR OF npr1-1 [Vigna angularis]